MSNHLPLVLIPSQLCTRAVWGHQIDVLEDRMAITVADHSGHDTIIAIATSILASAPGKFCLAAHGMGGFIAFEIMRQAPGRVARLALFDTLATADSEAQIKRRQGYADLVRAGKFDNVVDERIPILLHPDRQNDKGLLSVARKMAEETGPEAFLRQQTAIISRPDSRPGLKNIQCPTLVAIGRQDAITSVADAQGIAESIPGARLEIIEDCGHLAPLEQPAAVTALLKQWLG